MPAPDTPYTRNASTGSVGGAALGDLEHNGKLDIVMGAWDGHVYAWRPDASAVPGWPVATDTPQSARHPSGTDIYARDYKVATTPVLVDVNGDGHPDVIVALQDTAFGSQGAPVFGYIDAFSWQGNRAPAGPLLPHFPVTVPAAEQGYGTAQDFITEGVQTPAAYDTPSGPQLVANAGLFFSQTIDLRSGQMHQESPATIPASGPVDPPSPLVHFTTSPSLGHVGGGSLTAAQSGSAATDVVTGVVETPGLGVQVRSGLAAWDPQTGANKPQFTQMMQGLGFLSAPAIADVSGDGKPDILQVADSGALHGWDGTSGQPVADWPKWTGGWPLFTPAVGDLLGDSHNQVVVGLREGWLRAYRTPGLASANADAWHWHQNDRDSGHYGDDTRPPLAVSTLRVTRGSDRDTLRFTAVGDDWNVGTAARYELFGANAPITQDSVGSARAIAVDVAPAAAGSAQQITVPAAHRARFYALRAVDHAGNIGPLPVGSGGARPVPGGGRCISARLLTIHLRRSLSSRVLRASVTVNGRRVRVSRRFTVRLNLRRLPRQTIVVRIHARLRNGRLIRQTRRYHLCVKRRPRPRKHKRHKRRRA